MQDNCRPEQDPGEMQRQPRIRRYEPNRRAIDQQAESRRPGPTGDSKPDQPDTKARARQPQLPRELLSQ